MKCGCNCNSADDGYDFVFTEAINQWVFSVLLMEGFCQENWEEQQGEEERAVPARRGDDDPAQL